MARVGLEGVWYRYPGGRWVLRGVTLELSGGWTLIAGRTGSGKTTLLRVASGLAGLYGGELRGRVEADGLVVMVPQRFDPFILHPTPREEILHSLSLSRSHAASPAVELARIAEALGLDGVLDEPVERLSAGERQRVAIASAVALGADMLLLDEPLAYLDQLQARELLEALEASGVEGVVVAEHRLHALASRRWRVVVLEGGRVALDSRGPGALREAAGLLGEGAGGLAGLLGVWDGGAALQAAGCPPRAPQG